MGQRVSALKCCFCKEYCNHKIKMTNTENENDRLVEEELFGEAEFKIEAAAFSDQYDMQEKLKTFEGKILFNEDRSVTLITDRYVDGLKFIQQRLKLEQKDGQEIASVNDSMMPEMVDEQCREGLAYKGNDPYDSLLEPQPDKRLKRNRQLIQDLTPQTSETANGSRAVNRSLSQKFPIDEHLWHYLLFKHADKVAAIISENLCEAKVVSEFSNGVTSYFLEVSPYEHEKSDVNDVKNSIENAVEEFAQLFQKVSNLPIMEDNAKLLPELDKTETDNLKMALARMGYLLMPSDLHRLIGPVSHFEEAKAKVCEAINEHQRKTLSADDDKDETLKFKTPNGLKVFVSQGNLVKQTVDAIVNPANSGLGNGGGAARAIAKAAGPAFDQECREYIYKYHSLNTTCVMHTTAGNLRPKIKYVIHTVGPMRSDYRNDEDLFHHVKRTVSNCLHYANSRLKIQSIAIPAISSGIFGVPLRIVAEASFDALVDFDKTLSQGSRVLNEIHFLNKDQPTVSGMRTTFAALLKKTFGSSVDPVNKNNIELFDRYAAAFGRKRVSTSLDKNCFATAIATALQKDLKRNIDWLSVEERIKKELRDNHKFYKDFQLKSWSDWVPDIFKPSFLDSEQNKDLLLSAAANAFKLEIVVVQLNENKEPVEQSFKPRTSSVNSSDSIYISCYYCGHSHFDALIKVLYNLDPESSKPQSSFGAPNRNSNSDVITDQPGGSSRQPSNISIDGFKKHGKDEVKNCSSNNGSSAKKNAKDDSSGKNDKEEEDNMCIICMDTITDAKVLACKHKFCRECIDNCFQKHQPKCPSCGKVFGVMKGNQPHGTMNVREEKHQHLSGYQGCGSFEIHYSFPSGTQGENHPNPGQPYRGTSRTAFLPANKEGREVLQLLRRAFDAGLVFTIGRSNTTGQENVVIWNDVHHKTSTHGQYGYPDPTYLKRVKEELAAKGIQ